MKNVVYMTFEEFLSKKDSTNRGRGDPILLNAPMSEDVVLSNICGLSTRIFRGAIQPVNKTYKC